MNIIWSLVLNKVADYKVNLFYIHNFDADYLDESILIEKIGTKFFTKKSMRQVFYWALRMKELLNCNFSIQRMDD